MSFLAVASKFNNVFVLDVANVHCLLNKMLAWLMKSSLNGNKRSILKQTFVNCAKTTLANNVFLIETGCGLLQFLECK